MDSRIELLLKALVEGGGSDIVPDSRIETYLKAMITGDTNVPEPQSRIEAYLYQLAKNGSSGGGDDSLEAVIEGTATEAVLPNATKIRDYAFHSCRALENIIMPNVTNIGTRAFTSCGALAINEFPQSLTSVGSYAFATCPKLAVSDLSNLTKIGDNAFASCVKLETIKLSDNVVIDSRAFSYCSGLKTVTFKGKASIILADAFQNCANLTTINVPWAEGEVANAPWGATNATINYSYTGE